MKAVIIDIGKDYCIVLSRDGQFLKQRIPHGIFEIGDEITVSEEHAARPAILNMKMSHVRSLAAAASVIIIVAIGSIFGVWYMKNSYLREAGTADSALEEKLIVMPAPSEEARADEEMESAGESPLAMVSEEEAVAFENTYSLESQEEFEEDIKEIINFSYKIVDDVNLRIQLRNISDKLTFNGTFKLTLLSEGGGESREDIISLDDFGPGKIKEHVLFLKTEEKRLRLKVTGTSY
jgi:hypothetical protein